MNFIKFPLIGLITLVAGISMPRQSLGVIRECQQVFREQDGPDSSGGAAIRLGFGERVRYLLPSRANAMKRVLFANLWFETPSQKELFQKFINNLVFRRNKDVESPNEMDFEIEFQGPLPPLEVRFQFEGGSPSAGHLNWIPPQMNMPAKAAKELRSEFLNWLGNDPNLPTDFWQTFHQDGPIFYAHYGSFRSDLTLGGRQQGVDALTQQRDLRNFLYMSHSLSLFLNHP